MKGPVAEATMFEPEVEANGVKDILAALTEEEMKYLSDPNMPLRHFRAEKVRRTRSAFSLEYVWEFRWFGRIYARN
jgi:hypothetical protein